ncbi:hypothetical protein [Thalassobellus suaedae]|uniref:SGNH hydrolase domain-containing protein n=1 Tax=Thalassobellus suaedae TaxID=3074124 RepID=A0ABY9XUN6_9FLAO|nr:SGNH hydrolase domain-containing protein [Flavobacteriaceae bacterium HL-DH14]
MLNFFSFFKSKEKVFVFGDSHARVFNFINANFKVKYKLDVTAVGGATAQGLVNPRSKTNALKIFKEKIHLNCKKNDYLFFFIGEVDCGFVIWYRAKKYNESVDFQLERSINNYKEFLIELKKNGFKNIFIIETVPPTIFDGHEGKIAHERREVNVSIKKRTELTNNYNKRLEKLAKENEFGFVKLTTDLIDNHTGLVKLSLLNDDKTDHHLSNKKFAPIINKLMNDVLEK